MQREDVGTLEHLPERRVQRDRVHTAATAWPSADNTSVNAPDLPEPAHRRDAIGRWHRGLGAARVLARVVQVSRSSHGRGKDRDCSPPPHRSIPAKLHTRSAGSDTGEAPDPSGGIRDVPLELGPGHSHPDQFAADPATRLDRLPSGSCSGATAAQHGVMRISPRWPAARRRR